MRTKRNLAVMCFLFMFAFSFALGAVAFHAEDATASCAPCDCYCNGSPEWGSGRMIGGECADIVCRFRLNDCNDYCVY
jgi:hypothetical protein